MQLMNPIQIQFHFQKQAQQSIVNEQSQSSTI